MNNAKKAIALLLSVLTVVLSMSALFTVTSAAEESDEVEISVPRKVYYSGNNTVTFSAKISNNKAYITGCEAGYEVKKIEVPSKYKGYTVVGVLDLSSKNGNCYPGELVLPDSVTSISKDALACYAWSLKKITVGKNFKGLTQDLFSGNYYMESINVSTSNPSYTSKDGVAYNKKATKVIAYPTRRTGKYKVPSTVTDLSLFYTENITPDYDFSETKNFVKTGGIVYSKDKKSVITCDKTKSGAVTIPNTVTKIYPAAFYYCTNLTSVKVSNKVTEIVYQTSEGCSKLKSASLPSSVKKIGNEAFCGTALTSAPLTNSVKSIGASAFAGTKITKVTLPAGIEEIGAAAFAYTKVSSVKWNNKISYIPSTAFLECTSLTSFAIPSTVTDIAYGAFSGCKKLNNVKVPSSVKSIGGDAFSGCTSLTSISLPATISEIGYRTFYGCSSLKTANIPAGVKTIGYYAYGGCENLTTVNLPDGITEVSECAFGYSPKVKYNTYSNAKYLGNSKNKYLVLISATNTNITSCTVNPKTKVIADSAFYQCGKLASVTIPKGVITIGNYAFSSWSEDVLKTVSIPDTVTKMGSGVFSGRSNLSYYAYNNALYLGNASNKYLILAKAANTNITSCTINAKTKFILDSAFNGCKNLTSITIPKSVVCIGSNAFGYCSKLHTVKMANSGVTKIDYGAFNECTALQNLTIPSSVTDIDSDMISDCDKLKLKTYGGASYLGNTSNPYVMLVKANSTNITSVTINSKTRFINKDAFKNCTKLATVNLPKSVKVIFESAFSKCNSLKKVVYSGTKAEKSEVQIYYNNDALANATITYYTGLLKQGNKWYYYKNGVVDKSTTLVKYGKTYYYVKNGTTNNATTLVKYSGKWYYVKKGVLNKSNTLVKYSGKYYHVKNGTYNPKEGVTFVKYNKKWYYCKKGVANTKFSGKVKYKGKTYKVVKGIRK